MDGVLPPPGPRGNEQHIVRDVLVAALERTGLEVLAAADATEAVDLARRRRPDVALVDVHLPGGGVSSTEGIVRAMEGCRVLALATHGDGAEILQMLLAGAEGYVAKGVPTDEVIAIVRRSVQAEAGLSVNVVASLMRDLLHEIADLTEIKERLRRSEERFRGLLESGPDAVIIINRAGEIVLVNQQAELMFGYARNDLLGQPVEIPVPERFHGAHIEHRLAYQSARRTRRMGSVAGPRGRRRNATELPVDISLGTLETDEGTLIIAFVRDLSERERAVGTAPSTDVALRLDDMHRQVTIDLGQAEEDERAATARFSPPP